MDQQAAFDARLSQAERRLDQHDEHLRRLDGDMSEIRSRLYETATKDDIADLKNDIQEVRKSSGDVLLNALNSTPLWVTVLFGFVTVVSTMATVYFGFFHAAH